MGAIQERSSALPYTSVFLAIEKGAFWSPSTTVANFTYLLGMSYPTSVVIGHFFSVR